MPKPIDPKIRSAAERAYLSGDETLAEIARQFSVGDRTVEKWSVEDNWELKRQRIRDKVVEFARPEPRPAPVRVPTSRSSDIDELAVVEMAIADLSAAMTSEQTSAQSLGGIAGGIARLIELRRKLRPATAAELAAQVIELGIEPKEFVAELKRLWAQSA